MTETFKPALTVWILLVTISIGSWWLGNDHGLGARAAAVAIIVLALVKAGFVAWHFMDLRNAPAALARAMIAVLAISALALIGFYLA